MSIENTHCCTSFAMDFFRGDFDLTSWEHFQSTLRCVWLICSNFIIWSIYTLTKTCHYVWKFSRPLLHKSIADNRTLNHEYTSQNNHCDRTVRNYHVIYFTKAWINNFLGNMLRMDECLYNLSFVKWQPVLEGCTCKATTYPKSKYEEIIAT